MISQNLRQQFGEIDIYLFDQLLRGTIVPGMKVLDAGCGYGRNLFYLMREGYDVAAIDISPEAVERTRALAARLAPSLPPENFRAEPAEKISFPDESFHVVLSIAVLHFAGSVAHFDAMLGEMWRVLKPGGTLFARLASSIGIEERVRPLGDGRYAIPDGSVRFLVDEPMLLLAAERLSGVLADPIKTVNVGNIRCMTTWCLRKMAPEYR